MSLAARRKGQRGTAALTRTLVSRKHSRHFGKHIVIGKVTAHLRKRDNLPSQRFKLANAKLATKGLSGDLATVFPRPTTCLGQQVV